MDENSNVKVEINSDEYSAYITIVPDPDANLSFTKLAAILKQQGVVFGLKKDVLNIILARNKQGTLIDKILVAEGTRPFEGSEAHVDYKFEFSSKPKMDQSGRVDYREISRILNVSSGQLLAVKTKLKQSVDGMTVTGKKHPFPKLQDIPLRVGGNIEKEEQEDSISYKAASDGALKFENNYLSVFPTLEIREDVDFNVGNVHFKGDVKVGRDVLPDFVVDVEGKISVWGSAIACRLNAPEGIEVRAGIVGKNKGEAVSGQDIIATFVENAKLKAGTDITIKNGIIGSDVFCDGILKVEMPRSRIVGSTIRAAKGIMVYNAGSRFDTTTCLITGIDPLKEQEYFKIKKFLDSKLDESKEIEKKYGRSTLEKRNFSTNITQNIKGDITRWESLRREIKNILKRLKSTEEEMYDYDASIRFKETLYPRVSLTIGKYKLTTAKEYRNVTVRYSPDGARLVIQ
ncbi:MAG: DUF342 domain-containing protein [bacterium]|nr:DUF342 domain-containing protein [bacterium]